VAALEGLKLRAMNLPTASSARCVRRSACTAPAPLCKRLEQPTCSPRPYRFVLRVLAKSRTAKCWTPCIGTLLPVGAFRVRSCPPSGPVLSSLCAGRRYSGRAAARQARRRLQPAAAAAPEVASLPTPAPVPDLPEPTGEWSLLPWAETAEFQRDHLAWAHKRCGACLGRGANECLERRWVRRLLLWAWVSSGVRVLSARVYSELAAPHSSVHLRAETVL